MDSLAGDCGLGVANVTGEIGTLELPVPFGIPLGSVPGLGTSIGECLGLWGVALELPVQLGIPLGSAALEWPSSLKVCNTQRPV